MSLTPEQLAAHLDNVPGIAVAIDAPLMLALCSYLKLALEHPGTAEMHTRDQMLAFLEENATRLANGDVAMYHEIRAMIVPS